MENVFLQMGGPMGAWTVVAFLLGLGVGSLVRKDWSFLLVVVLVAVVVNALFAMFKG